MTIAALLAHAQHGAAGRGERRAVTELKLADGSSLSAGMAIFACGPWLPTVQDTVAARGGAPPSRG